MPTPQENVVISGRIAKAPQRSHVACRRCHAHKIKCSGGNPCRGCQVASKPTDCAYPVRNRKVLVPESYIEELKEEIDALKEAATRIRGSACVASGTGVQGLPSERPAPVDCAAETPNKGIATPLFEAALQSNGSHASPDPMYVGDASCTGFGIILGDYAKGRPSRLTSNPVHYFRHESLLRYSRPQVQLPNRTYAKMLVQVVLRFVGSDYHFIRRKSFDQKLEAAYHSPSSAEPIFLCQFFVILAQGELYAKKGGFTDQGGRTVPGVSFFLQAMSFFQDLQEEADVGYIETLLLLSFYSLALNRKKTAYAYVGTALRLSITLGLHRNSNDAICISRVDVENQRRVWWTAYTYDRLLSAKLGYPVTVRDEDIDTPLPSTDGLSAGDSEDFLDPGHLIANIKLSKITGTILNLIYSIPAPKKGVEFVKNVHGILTDLRRFDNDLPGGLKLDMSATPSYPTRNVASLRLHFNQCIILTTRPIFLHVFKYYSQTQGSGSNRTDTTIPPSPTVSALAEACISAARASNKLVTSLWVDGNLAVFGYFDAHYIFSSTMVLIMSNVLSANDQDVDAIETGKDLLRSMADEGNIPASDYQERLVSLETNLGGGGGGGASSQSGVYNSENPPPATTTIGQTGSRQQSKQVTTTTTTGSTENNIHHYRRPQAPHPQAAQTQTQAQAHIHIPRPAAVDSLTTTALDNPSLQDFLMQSSTDWTPGLLGSFLGENASLWRFGW